MNRKNAFCGIQPNHGKADASRVVKIGAGFGGIFQPKIDEQCADNVRQKVEKGDIRIEKKDKSGKNHAEADGILLL